MKLLAPIIAVSLAANVVLGVLLIRPRSVGSIPEQTEVSTRTNLAGKRNTPIGESPEQHFAPAAPATSSWKDIGTSDLKELIRRLRSVGCPEETIQDIVLAAVNRQYAAKSAALWPDRYKIKPFWETDKPDPAQSKQNRERTRKERELRAEKSALLVELLGVDPEKEQRKADGTDDYQDWTQRRIAFLPESKREQVGRYLDEFEDKLQDFYARNRGLWDAESRAEQRQLEQERLQGLGQFLSPEEVREFDLRSSQLANQLSRDLRGMSLTREEYETVFDLRKKYADSIYNYADIESKEARQQAEDNRKAFKAEIAGALGNSFAKDYERSQDYSYQQLTRLARRNDLPATTAATVYDVKDAAQQSVKQLQDDKTLSVEQRQQALQGIRSETEKTLKDTLGEAAYKSYIKQGGWWLNNLAPTPRPQGKS